jgi:ribose transport system permease protein
MSAAPPDVGEAPAGAASRPRHPLNLNELAIPLALAILIVFGCIAFEEFRTGDNLRNVLAFTSVPFIVAIGQTVVVLARGVDLSVGSMMALSGAIFATLMVGGTPFALSLLITLVGCTVIGLAVNGLLITKLGVSFLIVTLGTFSIFRSIATVSLDGVGVTVDAPVLDALANDRIGPVPVPVVIAAVLYAVMVFVLRGTTYGRMVYAVGASPQAARLAGMPVNRVITIGYGVAALFAAIAGLLTLGQLGSAQPTAGVGAELNSLAAVLLGGTLFSGGYGGITRTLTGVLFLAVLLNLLLIAGINSFWQGAASGLVLIAAVAIDRSRRD